MTRQRVRLRFRKIGDLRLISHRDLARCLERWLRRAGVPLGMSEGFHPRAKMSFPAPLALGIAGLNEVMEFELAEPRAEEELRDRLAASAPRGLEIVELRLVPAGEKKPRVCRMRYTMPIPPARCESLQDRIRSWKHTTKTTPYLIRRAGREEPVDVKAGVDQLELHDGQLRFRLIASSRGNVRPREVLEALGVAELENQGCYLTRIEVEVST
jgi:radical SAM-linked protein